MPFDPTPNGALSNSYPTVAEFDAYWAMWTIRKPSWIATAVQAQKEAALMAGTMMIDSLVDWTGVAATDGQALAWGRSGMLNRNGRAIASNVIPNELKNAVCEYAGQLGATDLLATDDSAVSDISGVTAGDVSVQFSRAQMTTYEAADIRIRLMSPEFNFMSRELPEAVRRLLVPSWINVPTVIKPALFKALGGSRSCF